MSWPSRFIATAAAVAFAMTKQRRTTMSERSELERLRIQLAGCGVAAMQNTRSSMALRIGADSPYWSASYRDVCLAVDREVNLREQRDAYVAQLLGWLSGDIPELHSLECPRLIESWKRFDAKRAINPETTMTDQTVEQEIQAKGLTAPRITPADIDAAVAAASYHVFEGTTTTVCCLLLRNGFTVIGESACASPANFDAELGKRIARDNAKQKIWALEGYLLRDRLCRMAAQVPHDRSTAPG